MRILITCVGGELMPQFLFFLKNNKEKKVFLVGVDKNINAIVTAPISKQSLHLAKHFFDGHTGLLGSLFGIAEPYLLLSNKRFSTLHVTCHKSLLDAISLIKKNRVADVIQIGHDHMVKIGIKKPRIAGKIQKKIIPLTKVNIG